MSSDDLHLSPDATLPFFPHGDKQSKKINQVSVSESCHSGLRVHNGFPVQPGKAGCGSVISHQLCTSRLPYEDDRSRHVAHTHFNERAFACIPLLSSIFFARIYSQFTHNGLVRDKASGK